MQISLNTDELLLLIDCLDDAIDTINDYNKCESIESIDVAFHTILLKKLSDALTQAPDQTNNE